MEVPYNANNYWFTNDSANLGFCYRAGKMITLNAFEICQVYGRKYSMNVDNTVPVTIHAVSYVLKFLLHTL